MDVALLRHAREEVNMVVQGFWESAGGGALIGGAVALLVALVGSAVTLGVQRRQTSASSSELDKRLTAERAGWLQKEILSRTSLFLGAAAQVAARSWVVAARQRQIIETCQDVEGHLSKEAALRAMHHDQELVGGRAALDGEFRIYQAQVAGAKLLPGLDEQLVEQVRKATDQFFGSAVDHHPERTEQQDRDLSDAARDAREMLQEHVAKRVGQYASGAS